MRSTVDNWEPLVLSDSIGLLFVERNVDEYYWISTTVGVNKSRFITKRSFERVLQYPSAFIVAPCMVFNQQCTFIVLNYCYHFSHPQFHIEFFECIFACCFPNLALLFGLRCRKVYSSFVTCNNTDKQICTFLLKHVQEFSSSSHPVFIVSIWHLQIIENNSPNCNLTLFNILWTSENFIQSNSWISLNNLFNCINNNLIIGNSWSTAPRLVHICLVIQESCFHHRTIWTIIYFFP